jgi:hypothetical protein
MMTDEERERRRKLREELYDARIDAYVKRVVAEAPPLTNQQRNKLWELLRPVRERRGEELRSLALGKMSGAQDH